MFIGVCVRSKVGKVRPAGQIWLAKVYCPARGEEF